MTEVDHSISRRTALAALGAAGAAGAAGALAACSSGDSPSGGSSSTTGGGGSTTLVRLDSIPVGHAVSATLDSKPVIVARPSTDKAACFSAICTHMGCTVAPAGTQLHCPCHGSVYNATTGAVISGPAPKPLPPIPVTVQGGKVVAGGAGSA